MYNFLFLFIFFIIVLSLFIYTESRNNEIIYVESSLDHRKYLVRNVADKQEAADMLANMRDRLDKLINYMRMNHPNDDRVKRLIRKFNPDRISESLRGSKYTSYSINKGEKIVLCLRSKDMSQRLTDINTLMFVTLHELAHIMTISIGHTKEFWSNFKFILKIAVQIGIYDNIDYSKDPQPYCGIEVNDSPLHNESID
jgi:predicted metal-dependent hydrolase